ncbi:HpcH/HpaI aldolase/citrate lyase family protein [Piscinibacter koreensis]|uniref:CoA ester lyase n=1 Tax=Piscinibacter koreensis TaxID=2742824 RepID=A0A7Y6NMS5_9BURK|nr:CoA ester lyase [Schlegelella koreensis]NUZ06068.1 CoA ester lyase [Schlegelella koreensis]
MSPELPVWRSLLYVPAHVERFVARAHERGADCIQIDLEDSVPPSEKELARRCVAAAAERVRAGGADVLVRINRPLGLAVRDIEAAVGPHVDGFTLTKVASADHVRLLDELIGEVEQQRGMTVGHSRLIVLIESADAWLHAAAIARASPRIVALNLASEDFALDCGIEPSFETLLMPKQQLVYAARAAGVLPLGLVDSMTNFADEAKFADIVRRSRRFGFVGASCIHPAQVPILNALFAPSSEEVERARRVIDALEAATREGRGAAALDGRMIDAPIAENARRLIARHTAIAARAARA